MIHKGRAAYDYANCRESRHWFEEEDRRRQRTNSIDESFFIMSAEEILEAPAAPEWFRRDVEERFRKGFYNGYDEAVRHVAYLKRKGFLRPTEIANILYEFSEDFLRKWWKRVWRDDIFAHDFSFGNPRFKHESWWALRQLVFDRDGRRCLVCKSPDKLEADHIVPVCEGGLPTLENLQTLCKKCHRGVEDEGES